ncbi:MAG: helix-turn-helix transcriptional regulator [Anaerolineae bacterium]|nr:helix-turn-helix transcriptional regulator [Anaerolineae bacterium]MDQ7036255.1 helix-turn-helix transcriptional regulator [Anaerolineae bacterium]
MGDIKQLIGNRIRSLRQEASYSQEVLAHRSSLDRTYINSVENGHRNISIVNLEKIASALDVSLAEFFGTSAFEEVPHDE